MRNTASGKELADIDAEISAIRGQFDGPVKAPKHLLSPEEEAIKKEITAARRRRTRAADRVVMRDDRETVLQPIDDELDRLEQAYTAASKRAAKSRMRQARLHDLRRLYKGEMGHLPQYAAGAATFAGFGGLALGGLALSALSSAQPKKPMSPSDPQFYWSAVSKDKDKMLGVQLALSEWGHWDDEVDMNGNYGVTTKAAIRAWRADRGLDPDGPMTRDQTKRLLAGPKGYKDGKAWYYEDGTQVSAP